MPWLATGASVCGTLKPPVRTDLPSPCRAEELGHDLVDEVLIVITMCLRSWAPAHGRVPRPGVFR